MSHCSSMLLTIYCTISRTRRKYRNTERVIQKYRVGCLLYIVCCLPFIAHNRNTEIQADEDMRQYAACHLLHKTEIQRYRQRRICASMLLAIYCTISQPRPSCYQSLLSIPDICHGRHGRRPCKFFLPGVNFQD